MADPNMLPAGGAPTDPRLWILAAVAVINLGFSFFTFRRTCKTAKETRLNRDAMQRLEAAHKARSIRLEEFRSTVRDPVRDSLLELRGLGRRLEGVAQTKSPIEEHETDISELNEQWVQAMGTVYDALDDANRSKFADGNDWAEGVSELEDAIANAFNCARDSRESVKDRLTALTYASGYMKSLRGVVTERIEHALNSFAEDSALVPEDCNNPSPRD